MKFKHMASRFHKFAFSSPTLIHFKTFAFSKYSTMKKHTPQKEMSQVAGSKTSAMRRKRLNIVTLDTTSNFLLRGKAG